MKRLKWTVIATQVPAGGSLGGVVRYTTELTRALAERDDVSVSVLTTPGSVAAMRELVGPDARIDTVPSAPAPVLAVLERHAPLPLLRNGAEVVHGMKHLIPRHSNALRVLTVHDMLLLDRPTDFGAAKRLLLPGSYRASLRQADLLLCVSAATRERVQAHVPGTAARSTVVHLATSSSLRAAHPSPIPALAGSRFALVVGDPTPRKNLRTVMAAWPTVRRLIPDAVLAVAGPPSWGQTNVGSLYDGLVSDGAVVALGHVDDAQLRWAYENAAVVLCPSLAEGYGLPAAEALDLGAPVVISEDAALQEVSAGRASAVVAALDIAAWSTTIGDVLTRSRSPGQPSGRTWADVGEETVRSVRDALTARR